MEKILEVKDLNVSFHTYGGEVQAVRGVNFDLYKGETLAIVGESGSGKTVTAQTLMKLIPMPPGKITSGQILFDGKDLSQNRKGNAKNSWKRNNYDFPRSNDFFKPNDESRKTNYGSIDQTSKYVKNRGERRALELLKLVGIPMPEKRVNNIHTNFQVG